jgi:hypothetical protein
METCPGAFTAATEAELLQHIEAHARIAHEEHPDRWTPAERQAVMGLIRAA